MSTMWKKTWQGDILMSYKISKWKEVAWVNDRKKQPMDLEEAPLERKNKEEEKQ